MSDAGSAPASGMRAITVSREYGSGGGEIAARLAGRLGWTLVDHEVVEQVARALGVTEEEAEAYDEHSDNLISRVLSSLTLIQPAVPVAVPVQISTASPLYDQARRKVVQAAVDAGHVVIVGRGGQVLLADRRDVLHVRVVAPLEERIAYVMQREGLDHATAQARISAKDRDRAHFLQTAHHRDPADACLYDIVVNTGIIDLESIVDIIALALERKARMLSAPAEQLGPGAGLPRYPEPPGNFPTSDGGQAAGSTT